MQTSNWINIQNGAFLSFTVANKSLKDLWSKLSFRITWINSVFVVTTSEWFHGPTLTLNLPGADIQIQWNETVWWNVVDVVQ